MQPYLLAIDQGTTSSRAMVFTKDGKPQATHQVAIEQFYPHEGWVEHDAEEIWQSTFTWCKEVIAKAQLTAAQIAAIGISNQRETTILWDKRTGKPVQHAIVWQDRRTADYCHQLLQKPGVAHMIQAKTGLLIDPYFCASKIRWLLDHIPGLRDGINKGHIAFGTVDSYLLWHLTNGKVHATDATNASRTLLFNIHTQQWDDELLSLFDIPKALLPEVKDSNAHFGVTDAKLFGAAIPITGIAGDQQAAMVGQTCFKEGMIKSTYGTGCFIMLNTGNHVVNSTHQLLSTIGYRINGQVTYALEGSIFVAGAAVQWLRDGLHLFGSVKDTQSLAQSINSTRGVYLVPAFTGLGAPYWDPLARGAIFGLTRDTSIADIVRAALEAVCYQTFDLLDAMTQDFKGAMHTLRVDGGMIANDWLLQFLADILSVPVERPQCVETSALGAAYLAGLGVGVYQSLDEIADNWHVDLSCYPTMESTQRDDLLAGWRLAIKRVIG